MNLGQVRAIPTFNQSIQAMGIKKKEKEKTSFEQIEKYWKLSSWSNYKERICLARISIKENMICEGMQKSSFKN